MKNINIIFPYDIFPGGFLTSIGNALEKMGHTIIKCPKYKPQCYTRIINRLDYKNLFGLKSVIQHKRQYEFNNLLINLAKVNKANIFFSISGGGYLPQTIKKLKQDLGLTTITLIADNPCDPRRDKYFAMSLRYYDIILYADKIWLKILDKLAPQAKKIKFLGGYDPEKFFPIDQSNIPLKIKQKLSHDVVFTGGSYKESAEGAYRAGVLGQLAEDGYDVQIWGDEGWMFREQFYPALKGRIHTSRLTYKELRALIRLSKIYVNMPSPQIFTSFQPRVFEIAAAKGFQIIDHSDELDAIFGTDYVSFKTYDELKEKINYYILHTEERNIIVERMYEKVKEIYTWDKQIYGVLKECYVI